KETTMSNELTPKNQVMNTSSPVSALEKMTSTPISRRNLLGMAGQGILGMGLLALLGGRSAANAAGRTPLERMLPGAKELSASPSSGPGTARAAFSLGASPMVPTQISLPFWGDGLKFDQPEYYETLCVGDLDGDGQDELIIRGPNGILVEKFDSTSGQ